MADSRRVVSATKVKWKPKRERKKKERARAKKENRARDTKQHKKDNKKIWQDTNHAQERRRVSKKDKGRSCHARRDLFKQAAETRVSPFQRAEWFDTPGTWRCNNNSNISVQRPRLHTGMLNSSLVQPRPPRLLPIITPPPYDVSSTSIIG